MKKTFVSLLALLACLQLSAQVEGLTVAPDRPMAEPALVAMPPAPDYSVVFAEYPDQNLSMDVYMPKDGLDEHYCVVFAYGGGFIDNNQKQISTTAFCRKLADDGYVAVAIDYRLGLKGVSMKGTASMVKPLEKAVTMAAEDMMKATAYIVDHSGEMKVKKDGIVLCGSSAGAMTSLQTDYFLCNGSPLAAVLPDGFRFAGVMSFAGAVFSREGKCDYTLHEPAPTFLLHGTSDRLVTYKNIHLFRMRLSGSNDLVKSFKKNGYPYRIMRFVDEGHGVSIRMMDNYSDVIWFLENMVRDRKHFEIDETVYDKDHQRTSWDSTKPGALYK